MPPRLRDKRPRDCDCGLLHEHGTLAMYRHHSCGCLHCRVANAALAADRRAGVRRPPERYVDATGTVRRLRALAALGVRIDVIASRLGVTTRAVAYLRDQRRVRVDTAARVQIIYNDLWDAPAEFRSQATSRNALRLGWLPPLAWDDDTIDLSHGDIVQMGYGLHQFIYSPQTAEDIDKIAVERAVAGERIPLNPAEVSEARVTLERMGLTAREIAERLGVSERTVVRRRAGERAA